MSQAPTLSSIGWTVRDYARRVWDNAIEDHVLFLASGVAFDILLAAVPFVLTLVSGVAFLLGLSPLVSREQIGDIMDRMLPPHAETVDSPVHRILADAVRSHRTLGIWSAVVFIFLSTRLFASLRTVLAEVFDIEQERGIIEGKLFDIRITIVATLLFAANTIVTAYLSLARSRGFDLLVAFGITREALGGVEYLVGRLLAWAFLVAMFFGLYKFLPVRKVRWQAAAMAALFTSVLLELAKVVFAWIVRSFNPGSMYTGTLAAIVIVVVWVYYAAIIFILGGEVGQVYDLRHVRRLRREVFTH